jgi:phosphoglycerate dehydrogenase-like enzyme
MRSRSRAARHAAHLLARRERDLDLGVGDRDDAVREKRLPDAWIHEPPAVWNIFDLGGLYGRTLGLLGMGGIAQETAKRALAFGMTVIAHRRTAQPSPVPGVDMVDFDALLARSDHLVIAAPATRETRHVIDRERSRARSAACTSSTSRAAISSTRTRCAPRSTTVT